MYGPLLARRPALGGINGDGYLVPCSFPFLTFAFMKILMVCLGNICRSPLAEGILQQKALKAGLNWSIESAGTGTWHIGQPPHHLSQKVAVINDIDISQQRCRQFRKEDMLEFDRIYVMDQEIYREIKRMSGELWNKNKVEFLLNEIFKKEDRGVPDPYLGTEKDYHEVYSLINIACDAIIEKAQGSLYKAQTTNNQQQASSNQ